MRSRLADKILALLARPLRTAGRALTALAERQGQAAVWTGPPVSSGPAWELSLLVDADDERGCFSPSVHIRWTRIDETTAPRLDATVLLVVVDEDKEVRLAAQHAFSCAPPLADVSLGTLTFPRGERMVEAAGWDWWVLLVDAHGELARYRGSLTSGCELNDEAELAFPHTAA